MEAYVVDTKQLLFDGNITVHSPVPRIDEIISCKNFVIMRIYSPVSAYYRLTEFTPATLDGRYESEYPRNMPRLSKGASDAESAAPVLAYRQQKKGEEEDLKKPVVAFIYAKLVDPIPLTRELYNEIKKFKEHPVYSIIGAEHVTEVHDPARPGERYISMCTASVPDVDNKLIGWVLGFESGIDTLLTGDRGFNVVFPANRGEDSWTDLNFEDAIAGVEDVVLHNTDTHIGCFGASVDIPVPSEERTIWPGPGNGRAFFDYHIRQLLVVRYSDNKLPRIGAIMCAPATEYAGETTGLLPRSLVVSEGSLPADDAMRDGMFALAILGGGVLDFDVSRENMVAVFPTLRTQNRLVHILDKPYAPLHDLMSQDNTSVFKVRKMVTRSLGGHVILNVHDDITGSRLGGALIPFGNELPDYIRSVARPIFIDGARDDRVFSVSVNIFSKGDITLPIKPPGKITGGFLDMTRPTNEANIWNDLDDSSYITYTPDVVFRDFTSDAVFCRTTQPPVSDRGVHEPYMKLSSLVPLPPLIPYWALAPSNTPSGNNKFTRHIFVSAIRNSHWLKTITNKNGTVFSPEQWLTANLQPPNISSTNSEQYTEGERVYTRLYVGNDVSNEVVEETITKSNVWVTSENGSIKEKILFDSRLVGDWGLIVFGIPTPNEPADRYTNWRSMGRLNVMVTTGETILTQPVTPMQTRLATWPRGNPIFTTVDGDTIVRLDSRVGGVGSANGFYNPFPAEGDPARLTTSLIFVNFIGTDVKYVERVPLLWKYEEDGVGGVDKNAGLITMDRNVLGQKRMWNRTMYDHDKLFLCVKVPEAAKNMEGSSMFIDNLVFICSASTDPPEERLMLYNTFISQPGVIFNHTESSFNINVPDNFTTTCGFTL
uniref:Envelope protein n=1 Tax=Chionoecetes opilio bacilliform virus TaxID=1825681 RepID=A0A1Q3DKR1_9VIRU|nr:envelope protein [Chionoecetes opilio bacilliform virus]